MALTIFIKSAEHSFFREPDIMKWGELSWNDFNGFPLIVSRFGAGISTGVYTEFDSINNRYKAFAAHDRNKSWTKSRQYSDRFLKHEQTHFNISEYFSRIFDDMIVEKSLGGSELEEKHLEIKTLDNELQAEYDSITDHSVNICWQHYWNYKVDSLLATTTETGWHQDAFNSATVFFPDTVVRKENKEGENGILSMVGFENYKMVFMFTTALFDSIVNYQVLTSKEYLNENLQIEIHDTVYTYLLDDNNFKMEFGFDRENKSFYTQVHRKRNKRYLYQLQVLYPYEYIDSTGCQALVNSIFGSFRLEE